MDFRFEHRPGTVRYGDGCVAALGAEPDAIDAENALLVTGRTGWTRRSESSKACCGRRGDWRR